VFELSAHFNVLEHRLEPGAVDLPMACVKPIAREPASLESLAPSLAPQAPAAAVEAQHLDLRGASIGEMFDQPQDECRKVILTPGLAMAA